MMAGMSSPAPHASTTPMVMSFASTTLKRTFRVLGLISLATVIYGIRLHQRPLQRDDAALGWLFIVLGSVFFIGSLIVGTLVWEVIIDSAAGAVRWRTGALGLVRPRLATLGPFK